MSERIGRRFCRKSSFVRCCEGRRIRNGRGIREKEKKGAAHEPVLHTIGHLAHVHEDPVHAPLGAVGHKLRARVLRSPGPIRCGLVGREIEKEREGECVRGGGGGARILKNKKNAKKN